MALLDRLLQLFELFGAVDTMAGLLGHAWEPFLDIFCSTVGC